MDCDDEENSGAQPFPVDEESRSAVNSLILDYYKKFGRKRDLEQYFSLSTAQSDIRDPSSSFWRSMKTEESEDSGERSDKKSESSQELCRISIKCSVPDPSSTSQDEDCKTKTESVSPPIIIEEISHDSRQNSEDDALKSDDNHSQKSFDVMLDTSTNKPLSPSSSITSQRKLEWDSLADVGYANESDRKTSASSLSTLERLALKQQYSNNDTQPSDIGPPTSHSTPLEDERHKNKKGVGKKSTKIHKKDVDFLEVNVPHSSSSNPSINVNLTKHISFNVEKDGKVTLGSVQKDVSVSPEKAPIDDIPTERKDKEIQTSLLKTKVSSTKSENPAQSQKIPILIGLNTLRRTRRKRFRMARRKLKTKKKSDKANVSGRERSVTEQLSEAESFEYMPGHIYNQNQMTANESLSGNVAGNKSSLESSAAHTTDSSKGSKHSFTKDLEKGIDLLKNALQNRCDDAELKRKLIKQVCKRLLNSQYRDDDSTTDFLSGLSFGSKKLGLEHHTTTSTSEGNNSAEKSKRPKKSILRADKFNPGSIASTSQSAPNLPVASKSDKLVTSNLTKTFMSSNTDSDLSSKDKTSSDNAGPKVTSDALYQKYLQALKREEAYKRHLKDKEMFLKQKLVCSDSAFQIPARVEVKANDRLKDLINDLTRNNYDDGSGDASKLEGGPGSSRNFDRLVPNRNQRSHSVFTLSSGNSDGQKKPNLKKRLQCEVKDLLKPGTSKETETHYCCCPHHSGIGKMAFADSSVQVNIKNTCTDENCPNRESPRQGQMVAPSHVSGVKPDRYGDIKLVCHCQTKNAPNDALRYKRNPQFSSDVQTSETSNEVNVYPCQHQNVPSISRSPRNDQSTNVKSCAPNLQIKRQAKSSQTNMLLKLLRRKSSNHDFTSSMGTSCQDIDNYNAVIPSGQSTIVYESTRCIQTEISINPRIAEPTLSDINIVNESECVKVISEHCRRSSKPSITNIFVPQHDTETCTTSDSMQSSGTSNNGGNEFLDDAQSRTNDVSATYNIDPQNLIDKNKPGNFTIPIQGTNMTLLVSIGSDRRLMGNKAEGMIPISTGISAHATSVPEESLRSWYPVDHNSNRTGQSAASELINSDAKTKKNVIARSTQSYSLNDNIDKDRHVQTDEINKRDVQTQENVPIETQTPEYLLDPNKNLVEDESKNVRNIVIPHENKEFDVEAKNNEKCPCGCEGVKDNCLEDCARRTENFRGLCEKLLRTVSQADLKLDKRINTDNVQQNKQQDKCPCGCDGLKENCQKDCANQTGQLGEPCGKQTMDKQSRKEKCFCGCNGVKENCKRDCDGGIGEPCEKPVENKGILIEKPKEICPCGCESIKGTCKKFCAGQTGISKEPCRKEGINCIERDLIPREPCTEKVLFSNQEEMCSCGCGGTKNNCKKNCDDLTVTPRDGYKNQPDKNYEDISVSPREGCIKQTQPQNSTKKFFLQRDGRKLSSENDKRKRSLENDNRKLSSENDNRKHSSENDNRKTSLENKTSSGSASLSERNDVNDCNTPLNEPKSPKLNSNRLLETHEKETNTEYEEYSTNANKNKPTSRSSDKKDIGIQKTPAITSKDNDGVSSQGEQAYNKTRHKTKKSSSEAEQTDTGSDPILNLIQDITRRYSKNDLEKNRRKKCFTEIVLALNYLLETDDCNGRGKVSRSSTTPDDSDHNNKRAVDKPYCQSSPKKVDKSVQLPRKLSKTRASLTQCSEVPTSDNPTTSSDSAACKVLNKIKKECEKYHQKRCKVHCGKKCDASSSTSINCDQCRRVHHCACRSHKCKGPKKSAEKIQKGAIAYNLILQTSESMISEGTMCNEKSCQLKNVIVKVPKRKPVENIPFKEMARKFEKNMDPSSPRNLKSSRSRSLPNESEISSMDEIMRKSRGCTVREYLEKNRPDFVERSSQRQNCLRYVSECRANEREVQRDMLAMYMAELPDVTTLDSDGLRRLAKDLGKCMRKKKPAPKFISEREMKKHSEKIYKSLPEVVRKKEEIKKENIKKTNLLMASIFKKNLQKKTLRGSVNLSNYSTVIQI